MEGVCDVFVGLLDETGAPLAQLALPYAADEVFTEDPRLAFADGYLSVIYRASRVDRENDIRRVELTCD